MTFLPLSQLLQQGRPNDYPVARRNGTNIPFRALRKDALSIATQFRGRRVVLACTDSYHYAVGLFGLLHGGAEIILPPNTLPTTLLGLKDHFDCMVDDNVIASTNSEAHPLSRLDGTKPSLHFFTSGSTGVAKQVTKSLSMFEAETVSAHKLWGNAPENCAVFSSVPHHHVYGSSFKIFWPLAAGIPFDCATPGPWETVIAGLLPQAILVCSPAHLNRLSGLSPLPNSQTLSRVFCAGAPLSFKAAQETKHILGCLPTEIFGSTETCAIATRQQVHGHELWTPLPGVEVKCTQDGRMELLSPFAGNDWTTTEDRIECTQQGFFFLGRADDIVKIEGRRVSLLQIEKALTTIPFIADAAVVLLDAGESQLGAAVELKQEGRVQLEKIGAFRFSRVIRQALSPLLEPISMPRQWRFVDILPVQHMGKRKTSDIISLFMEQDLPSFSILSQNATSLTFDLFLDGDNDAFKGHFPGAPVLPGIVQLDWAIQLGKRYLAIGEPKKTSLKIKFHHPILPGPVGLSLSVDRMRQRLNFSYTKNDKKFSSGEIVLGSQE